MGDGAEDHDDDDEEKDDNDGDEEDDDDGEGDNDHHCQIRVNKQRGNQQHFGGKAPRYQVNRSGGNVVRAAGILTGTAAATSSNDKLTKKKQGKRKFVSNTVNSKIDSSNILSKKRRIKK